MAGRNQRRRVSAGAAKAHARLPEQQRTRIGEKTRIEGRQAQARGAQIHPASLQFTRRFGGARLGCRGDEIVGLVGRTEERDGRVGPMRGPLRFAEVSQAAAVSAGQATAVRVEHDVSRTGVAAPRRDPFRIVAALGGAFQRQRREHVAAAA